MAMLKSLVLSLQPLGRLRLCEISQALYRRLATIGAPGVCQQHFADAWLCLAGAV